MHCFHLEQNSENDYRVHVHHPLDKPRTASTHTDVNVHSLEDNVFCVCVNEWEHHEDKKLDWKRVCLYLSGEELGQLRDMIEEAIASN